MDRLLKKLIIFSVLLCLGLLGASCTSKKKASIGPKTQLWAKFIIAWRVASPHKSIAAPTSPFQHGTSSATSTAQPTVSDSNVAGKDSQSALSQDSDTASKKDSGSGSSAPSGGPGNLPPPPPLPEGIPPPPELAGGGMPSGPPGGPNFAFAPSQVPTGPDPSGDAPSSGPAIGASNTPGSSGGWLPGGGTATSSPGGSSGFTGSTSGSDNTGSSPGGAPGGDTPGGQTASFTGKPGDILASGDGGASGTGVVDLFGGRSALPAGVTIEDIRNSPTQEGTRVAMADGTAGSQVTAVVLPWKSDPTIWIQGTFLEPAQGAEVSPPLTLVFPLSGNEGTLTGNAEAWRWNYGVSPVKVENLPNGKQNISDDKKFKYEEYSVVDGTTGAHMVRVLFCGVKSNQTLFDLPKLATYVDPSGKEHPDQSTFLFRYFYYLRSTDPNTPDIPNHCADRRYIDIAMLDGVSIKDGIPATVNIPIMLHGMYAFYGIPAADTMAPNFAAESGALKLDGPPGQLPGQLTEAQFNKLISERFFLRGMRVVSTSELSPPAPASP